MLKQLPSLSVLLLVAIVVLATPVGSADLAETHANPGMAPQPGESPPWETVGGDPSVADPRSPSSSPNNATTANESENAEKIEIGLRNVDRRPGMDDPIALDGPSESIEVVFVLENASITYRPTLESMGASITSSYRTRVQATVEAARLPQYRNLEWVERVRRPHRARENAVSEGVSVIGADRLHDIGVTGTGVDVGIIDSGFDMSNPEIRDNVVAARSFVPGAPPNPAHGTAAAEVLVDTAPDADLYLATADTAVEYANAMRWLREQGVDVVSISMGYANAPHDGTGFVSRVTDEAARAGHMPVVSAGNEAFMHWEGEFRDADGNGYMEFEDSDETIALNRGRQLNGTVWITLNWNDWPASDQDYDLELVRHNPNGTETVVASSLKAQTGTEEPWEQIGVTLSPGNYSARVLNYDASGDHEMELFFYPHQPEYVVQSSSMEAPATGFNVTAVGAFDYRTGEMEYFTSHGPTNDGRVGIDVSGPDAVTTTAMDPFSGTSAATPHVAGVAALLMSVNESLTGAETEALLKRTAIDIPPAGVDYVSGYGRIDALAAYENVTGTTPLTEVQLDISANHTRVQRNGSVMFTITRADTGARVSGTVVIEPAFGPGQPKQFRVGPFGTFVHRFTTSGFYSVTVRKNATDTEQFRSSSVAVQVVPPSTVVPLRLTANRTRVQQNGAVEFTVTRTDTETPVNATISIAPTGASAPPGQTVETGLDGTVVHRFTSSGIYRITAQKAPTTTETFRPDSLDVLVDVNRTTVQLDLDANRTTIPSDGVVEFAVSRNDTSEPVNATITIRREYQGGGAPPGGIIARLDTDPDGRLVYRFPRVSGGEDAQFQVIASKAPTETEAYVPGFELVRVRPTVTVGAIRLSDVSGEPGTNVTTTLSATAADISAYQARLVFDPTLLQVSNVSGLFGETIEYRVDNAEGHVSLGGISTSSVTDPALANVTFTIVGDTEITTPVNFVRPETKLKRGALGSNVPLTYDDGNITIDGCIYGDANADGVVDVGDSVAILRYTSGDVEQLPRDLACLDLTGDGAVDTSDAIVVLRYALGLIETLSAP